MAIFNLSINEKKQRVGFDAPTSTLQKVIIALISLLTTFSMNVQSQNQPLDINTIFPIGEQFQNENFVGAPWVKFLFAADSTFNISVGNVAFTPKTRSNWHYHPSGQILLALNGVGYYQERGKEMQILRAGDAVKCPPNVEHWHGASHDDWFVQLAITAEHPEGRVIWLEPVSDQAYETAGAGAATREQLTSLSNRHQHFAAISSSVAKGDLGKLKPALQAALSDGLTINEIKEVIVHLYAYCGFPRSIQGLITFLSVVEERKTNGITDKTGKTASPIDQSTDKYSRGAKVLETLTGVPYSPPTSGYGAFSPEIDTLLKEHLFADIFERDVLSYQDREITTISALLGLGGVDRMLRGHMSIALNIGITEAQLTDLLNVVERQIGKNEADVGREIFSELTKSEGR